MLNLQVYHWPKSKSRLVHEAKTDKKYEIQKHNFETVNQADLKRNYTFSESDLTRLPFSTINLLHCIKQCEIWFKFDLAPLLPLPRSEWSKQQS